MSKNKITLDSIFHAIVAVLAIIVTGFYIANVNQAYYQDMNTALLCVLIITVILSLVPFGLGQVKNLVAREWATTLVKVALPSLIIYSAAIFVGMRVESFGYIFASNLEAGNEAATAAGTQAILVIGLFVITWLCSVVTSFFSTDAVKETV